MAMPSYTVNMTAEERDAFFVGFDLGLDILDPSRHPDCWCVTCARICVCGARVRVCGLACACMHACGLACWLTACRCVYMCVCVFVCV